MRTWLLTLALFGPPDEGPPVQRPAALGPAPTVGAPAEAPKPSSAVVEPEPAVAAPVSEPPASAALIEPFPAGEPPPPEAATPPQPAEPPAASDPPPPPAVTPDPVAYAPPPPRGRGLGLLIAAGGVGSGALAARILFGLVFVNEINQSTPDRAPRLYMLGSAVSIPAGAAIGLAATSRAFKARHDLYQDLYVFRTGPSSKRRQLAAGWSLFGAGVAGWIATRAAAPAVANRCPRGECFVLYMETSWYLSAVMTTAGAMLGAYGSHYTRLAKRWRTTGHMMAMPSVDPNFRGLSIAGRF